MYSKVKEQLKVTVGALSLITPDPEEQIISVFSIVIYNDYVSTNKLHDIALIEVFKKLKRMKGVMTNIIFCFSYLDRLYLALLLRQSDTMKLTNYRYPLSQPSSDGELLWYGE